LQEVYSVALGTSNVTPFEMAAAFSVFATLGVKHEPFLFWRVEDAYGRIIFEHIVQEKRVLDSSITYQLVDMMKSVIDTGSGKSIRQLGFDRAAAGKTGTTDNFNDAWFTGFTPTLCVSVWTGFDKERKLLDRNNIGITGGRGAAPIWADFMMNAVNSDPERDFPIPDNVHFETVDTVTGCPPEGQGGGREQMSVPLKTEQQLCRDEP
jgi:penicillin-binding protein 1A